MDGLGNYSRTNGFPGGSINLSFDTHTFTQDNIQPLRIACVVPVSLPFDSTALSFLFFRKMLQGKPPD
jgi:hypothetical protein